MCKSQANLHSRLRWTNIPREVNAAEYEHYVFNLLHSLDFGRRARTAVRATVKGVRQPGEYEIDIVVEFDIGRALTFVLIVECKNWKRRIDRPVVQKLIQTRDAVAAHKAAIASPVGFSEEAIKVARANGVALWILAHGRRPITVLYCKEAVSTDELANLRRPPLDFYFAVREVLFSAVMPIPRHRAPFLICMDKLATLECVHPRSEAFDRRYFEVDLDSLSAADLAHHDLAQEIFLLVMQQDDRSGSCGRMFSKRIAQAVQMLIAYNMPHELAEHAVMAAGNGNHDLYVRITSPFTTSDRHLQLMLAGVRPRFGA